MVQNQKELIFNLNKKEYVNIDDYKEKADGNTKHTYD